MNYSHHLTLLTAYITDALTTSRPGARFTNPTTRTSLSFVGNFPQATRASHSSPTHSPRPLTPPDILPILKRDHPDETTDLGKEEPGI